MDLLEELQVTDHASLMFGSGKLVDANEWLKRNDHEE